MSTAGSPQAFSGLSRFVASAAARVARAGVLAPTLTSFVQHPYRYFAWARRVSPVLWVNLLDVKGWLVTGFPEAEAILKDTRFLRDRRTVLPPEQLPTFPAHVQPAYEVVQRMLLFIDAPDHTRIRRLVTKAFTPAVIARMHDDLEALCHEMVDARTGRDTHELIADFSYPFPLRAIGTLLGIPPEDDDRFRHWSEQTVRVFDLTSSPAVWEECAPIVLEFTRYMEGLIERKRAQPAVDLISTLVTAEEQGDRLTMDELVSTCIFLVMAGHETTTNLITNGYYWLLKHPAQYARVKADPSLVPGAVEEMLRYEVPGFLTSRWLSEDLVFAGHRMKRGQIVLVAIGGANRDPRVFPRPNQFDVTRTPNRHLSFSAGAHYCIGAALGRMEAQVALRALLTRFENPVLQEEPTWRPSIVIRGFQSLRLRATVS